MEFRKEIKITREFLRDNPNIIFVFGDNEGRVGYGGAAALRDEPNTYGFITKKDLGEMEANYTPQEYYPVFLKECDKLREKVKSNPDKMFYVSKIGAGLANKFGIWEKIIEPCFYRAVQDCENVVLLWG